MSETLTTLRSAVLDRLGDSEEIIWTAEEVDLQLQRGYEELAQRTRVFWDLTYPETLPATFSYTSAFEAPYAPVDTGLANFTSEFERAYFADDRQAIGPGVATSVFEVTGGFLDGLPIPATYQVPKTVTEIERATWDEKTLVPLNRRTLERDDANYETSTGTPEGYLWVKDGIRTLRLVRAPSAQTETVSVVGAWGILRDPTDVCSGATVTGTWGCPRILPGHHPIGPHSFGIPRRVYLDHLNLRLEHWRHGRPLAEGCELPDHYAHYLRDFAQWQCLIRPSAGQDLKLAAHYQQRWERGIARLLRRRTALSQERVSVMGGGVSQARSRPARPTLPSGYPLLGATR